MNIKRTVLISVAVVMMISSIAMVSAADTDNITAATEDCRAGELKLADANIKSDTSIEIHALADTKEDEIAKGPSDVLAENGNSTNPAITIYDNGKYFGDKSITVKLIDASTNKSIAGATIMLNASNGKTKNVVTDSEGIATLKLTFDPGTYTITATYKSASASNTNVKIEKAPAKIISYKQAMHYGFKYFRVFVVNTVTQKPIAGAKVLLKVGHGKYVRKFYVKTDSRGYAYYSGADLKVGKHKVVAKCYSSQVNAKAKKTTWIIKKTKAKMKAKNLKVKKGKSKYFKVKITRGKRPLHSVRIKIELTKGKKTKAFHKRSDEKGFAKINTKKLPLGKYKVHITCKTSAIKAKEVNKKIKVI